MGGPDRRGTNHRKISKDDSASSFLADARYSFASSFFARSCLDQFSICSYNGRPIHR